MERTKEKAFYRWMKTGEGSDLLEEVSSPDFWCAVRLPKDLASPLLERLREKTAGNTGESGSAYVTVPTGYDYLEEEEGENIWEQIVLHAVHALKTTGWCGKNAQSVRVRRDTEKRVCYFAIFVKAKREES